MSNRSALTLLFALLILGAPAVALADALAVKECTSNKKIHCVVVTAREGRPVIWVDVIPEVAPPTRTRISFDRAYDAARDAEPTEQVTVEWDPYVASGLSRRVALTAGEWMVGVWSDPLRDMTQAGSNFAWGRASIALGQTGTLALSIQDGNKSDASIAVYLGEGGYALQAAATSLFTRTMPSPAPEVRSRSFSAGLGIVGEGADDLGAMVARAVLRKVKQKALDLVATRAQRWLCNQLRDVGGIEGPLLPATCKALSGFDLRTLAANPEVVLRAMLADVVAVARQKIGTEGLASAVVATAADAALALATPRASVTADRGQAILLGQLHDLVSAETDAPETVACVGQLISAVLAECDPVRGCAPTAVVTRLKRPADYYSLGGCQTALATLAKPVVAVLGEAILDGATVLRVAKQLSATERFQRLVSSLVHVADAAALIDCGGAEICTKHEQLTRLRRMLEAFSRADVAAGLTALGEVVGLTTTGKTSEAAEVFVKVTAILTAMSHYALLSREPGATESLSQARGEVEDSLLAILDRATSRGAREGDVIFTLSARLGGKLGYTFWSTSAENGDRIKDNIGVHQASLQLGIAADCLRERPWRCFGGRSTSDATGTFHKGWRAELSLLDLGNYARRGEFHWQDALQLGASLQWIALGTDVQLVAGASVGYRPTYSPDRDNVAYWAFEIGLQFPIIDLN